MLNRIRLKNFKLHEDTSIEATPITVFIGPNNSGKSSIFQAVLALKQATSRGKNYLLQPAQRNSTSADRPYLFEDGGAMDLGEFKDIVPREGSELGIGAAGSVRSKMPAGFEGPVDIDFDVRVRENLLVQHHGSIKTDHGEFAWQWAAEKYAGSELPSISYADDLYGRHTVFFSPLDSFPLLAPSGYDYDGPAGTHSGGGFGEAAGRGSTIRRHESVEFKEFCERLARGVVIPVTSVSYVPPVRGFEERGYPLPEKKPVSTELLSLSDRAVALAALLAYDRDLEERISRTLTELAHIRVKVRLVEGKRVTVWAEPADQAGGDTSFMNEGSGANQLPFILVPIAMAEPGDTILLSEPEVHLHPKAQSQLTSMLLEVSRKADLQFFIETHSEHVLHRLLHAVAKGELAHDHLAMYYFAEPKEGKADVRKLDIDEKGGVEGGLPGFFDQSLSELTDYLEALKPK